jgi:hypothetical protein
VQGVSGQSPAFAWNVGCHGCSNDRVAEPPGTIQLEVFSAPLATLNTWIIKAFERTAAAEFLRTIPGVQPVTAEKFLGSAGDSHAYESSA